MPIENRILRLSLSLKDFHESLNLLHHKGKYYTRTTTASPPNAIKIVFVLLHCRLMHFEYITMNLWQALLSHSTGHGETHPVPGQEAQLTLPRPFQSANLKLQTYLKSVVLRKNMLPYYLLVSLRQGGRVPKGQIVYKCTTCNVHLFLNKVNNCFCEFYK